MTKDGIREKVSRDLRALYDRDAQDPVPQEWLELLAKLK